MAIFHSIFLGFIQGVTEFLPISSSGHLVVLPWLFEWKDPGLAFDVFLHLGTLVAILLYFLRDWIQLSRAGLLSIIERRIGFDRDRTVFWLLVCGTLPAAAGGYWLHSMAESAFRSPLLVAVTLAGVGFVMYWVDVSFPCLKTIDELTFKNVMWIGIAQAFAIVPGVSRSGATISMGRFLGLSREAAARFSFLLSLPITLGASLFEFRKLTGAIGTEFSFEYCMAGFVTALIVGLVSIHGFLIYLKNADLRVFAWYRLGLAVVIVIVAVIAKR